MSRKKKPRMEYRYYEVPEKCPVLVLQGEKWLQNYGYQIDYLHFHNLMEIGFCYYGEGTIVLEDEELPYHGGMFTVVPKNFPHTTNSIDGSISFIALAGSERTDQSASDADCQME